MTQKKKPKTKAVGRPPIELTKSQIAEIEELAAKLTIEQIADYFDMSERTFYDIKNKNTAVNAVYKKGKNNIANKTQSPLKETANNGK